MTIPRLRKKVKKMDVEGLSLVTAGAEPNSKFAVTQDEEPGEAENDLKAILQEGYDALTNSQDSFDMLRAIENMTNRARLLVPEIVTQADDPLAETKTKLTGWENHLGFGDLAREATSKEELESVIAQYALYLREEAGLDPITQEVSGTDAEGEEGIEGFDSSVTHDASHDELDDPDDATDVPQATADGKEGIEGFDTACPNCGSKFHAAPIVEGMDGHGDANAKGKAAMGVAQSEKSVTDPVMLSDEDSFELDEEENGVDVIAQKEAPKGFKSPAAQLWGSIFGQSAHTVGPILQAEEDALIEAENQPELIPGETMAQSIDFEEIVAQAVTRATQPLVTQIADLQGQLNATKTGRKLTPKSRQIDGDDSPSIVTQSKKSVWQDGPLSGLFG